jgi:hypothetical protein
VVVVVVEEIKVEGVGEEGARPGEGEEAEVSVVETGGEVGVAGDGRRRRLAVVVFVGGGGWAEAGGEGGGLGRHFVVCEGWDKERRRASRVFVLFEKCEGLGFLYNGKKRCEGVGEEDFPA